MAIPKPIRPNPLNYTTDQRSSPVYQDVRSSERIMVTLAGPNLMGSGFFLPHHFRVNCWIIDAYFQTRACPTAQNPRRFACKTCSFFYGKGIIRQGNSLMFNVKLKVIVDA